MNRIEGKITILGGGKMGRAMVQGMLAAGVIEAPQVTVVDTNSQSLQWWQDHVEGVTTATSADLAIESAETVILAVKPGVIAGVARAHLGRWSGRLVISVAAGVTLARLQEWLETDCVVRVMPNTPCLVGAGASAFACGPGVSERHAQTVQTILGAVGDVAQVEEKMLDAVTGLSGSGPAYVFVMIEALADGGVAAGLPRELAQRLAAQTILGGAKMVLETGEHPAVLKDAVASPGGTTIAGLAALEENGLRSALIQAVAAAATRSKSLGASS